MPLGRERALRSGLRRWQRWQGEPQGPHFSQEHLAWFLLLAALHRLHRRHLVLPLGRWPSIHASLAAAATS